MSSTCTEQVAQAFQLLLLALDVKDVLARPDAHRVPHDVDDRERLERRLRQAVDRVDDERAPVADLHPPLVVKRLDEAVALRVGKGGVDHAADRRVEHLPVGPDLLQGLAEPRGPDKLAALLLLEKHVPVCRRGQTSC